MGRKDLLSEDLNRLRALLAVIAVADSNFPKDTKIEIRVPNRPNFASVSMASYELKALLREDPT